jgi:hypothetical protein
MKLYFGWAFAWGGGGVTLKSGAATIGLVSQHAEPTSRQVDVVVLTTDAGYRPLIKDRPPQPSWQLLDGWRAGLPALPPLAARKLAEAVPDQWRPRTFRDGGFLYLWNMRAPCPWLAPDAKVKLPYTIGDEPVRAAFEQAYAGRADVPIFSDPRIVPTFHGAGAGVFATEADGTLGQLGQRFVSWLDANPERPWAMMMNYAPNRAIAAAGVAAYTRYRDRYIGAIAGESLGYFYIKKDAWPAALEGVTTRRQLADAISRLAQAENAAKYKAVYGRQVDDNPYEHVIPCQSVGMPAFLPLASTWGPRTIGYESHVATSSILAMRMAFLRGIARQGGHLTATYRSCNFGDSSTLFSKLMSYTSAQNILDNYYSVYSGAGMTWYKFDLWYQYMAGVSMFYHEQGFDEWWMPGGTSAAGKKPVQLSPKGKLVDRFLRVTAADFDRGTPLTPIAFLVDYAHGWEPSPYWPNSFKNFHHQGDRWLFGDHEQMLRQTFHTAYHPIGPNSEAPINALNEVHPAGVFGDVFDVISAYPDVDRWTTIDSYPVVVATGEIALTAAEGERLNRYLAAGGTLVVAADHLTGVGAAALQLPLADKTLASDSYAWLGSDQQPSPRYRYRTLAGGRVLATSASGDAVCAAYDRGRGRLIVLGVPYALTVSRQVSPLFAQVLAHVRAGLLPVEVDGDIQWALNQNAAGYVVTLLNPYGQIKPQQGLSPTDYRENRRVTIRARAAIARARDRLLPSARLVPRADALELTVEAGGVRIIELTLTE